MHDHFLSTTEFPLLAKQILILNQTILHSHFNHHPQNIFKMKGNFPPLTIWVHCCRARVPLTLRYSSPPSGARCMHLCSEIGTQIVFSGKWLTIQVLTPCIRGVTIRVPHHTIRISIQRSRYNTYLNTYLNTVRCQRDVMSSMKAETPLIRSPAHIRLLQWMEYLLLQLPMLSQDVTLLSYIRVFPSIWSEKTMCFK